MVSRATPLGLLVRLAALAALLAASITVAAVPPASASTPTGDAAPGRPFTNPIKSGGYGSDPWLVHHNGNYHLITTSFTNELFMRESPTLAGLATAPSVQVWTDNAAGRNNNSWAPEPHFLNGRWYLYYSGGAAETPCCDWEQQGEVGSGGVINPVNEGPEPLQRNGKTFVIYSASGCQGPDYRLGQLTYNGGTAPISGSRPAPAATTSDGGSKTRATGPPAWSTSPPARSPTSPTAVRRTVPTCASGAG